MSVDQSTIRDDKSGVYCTVRCTNRNQANCNCRYKMRFNKPYDLMEGSCQLDRENCC